MRPVRRGTYANGQHPEHLHSMNERLTPYSSRHLTATPPDHPDRLPASPRRSLGVRLLGWALLSASLGLVSCQSLFVL
ncbi:MAG: hypothetical protein ACM3ST_14165 [Bdellovibrio bacteriovorus]